jgi:photosystem II stability/assembly factor-like uncharacterized protein
MRIALLLFAVLLISCGKGPTCSDGKLNQDEIRVDCGGASCPVCPTCFDGIQNQDEMAVDCGGVCGECPPIWVEITSGVSSPLNEVVFRDASTGFIVGHEGKMLRTDDAGASWTVVSLPTSNDLYDIHLVGDEEIYLVGNQVLLKSTNDGSSWSELTLPQSKDWRTIWFFDSDKGLIGGSDMTILKTDDGGRNWLDRSPNNSSSMPLNACWFISEDAGYMVGNGKIFLTSSGGAVWVETFAFDVANSSILFESITDIQYIDADHGFLCGSQGLLASESSIWINKALPVRNGYIDIKGPNGVYTGTSTFADSSVVMVSSNAGIFWSEESFPKTVRDVSDAARVDELHAVVITERGEIFRRQDRF